MVSNYIAHSGIKGQRWGVRRYQNEDGTLTEEGKQRYGYYDRSDGSKDYKRLQKDAEKDAKEYARAKAFYGEGAGTRRKQIKNLISERMKDEDYKAAFERNLAQQDMSKHQKAADRERKAKDISNSVGKTARGVKNLIMGVGSASLTAVALYNVANVATNGRAGDVVQKYSNKAISSLLKIASNIGRKASGRMWRYS